MNGGRWVWSGVEDTEMGDRCDRLARSTPRQSKDVSANFLDGETPEVPGSLHSPGRAHPQEFLRTGREEQPPLRNVLQGWQPTR